MLHFTYVTSSSLTRAYIAPFWLNRYPLRVRCGVLLAVFLTLGCSPSKVELSVNLLTDLVAPVEYRTVSVQIDDSPPMEVDVSSNTASVRLIDLTGLIPSNSRGVTLTLHDEAGEVIAQTEVLADNREDAEVTVTLPRSCRGVMCPGSGSPTAKACLGGKCVDSSCITGTEPSCPPPECVAASDCAQPIAGCVSVLCEAGTCIYPQGDSCQSTEYCVPETGCLPIVLACPEGCADDNPCTTDRCQDSECRYELIANDVPCTNGVCTDGVCTVNTPADASVDAMIDASVDATLDASVDATIDAVLDGPSLPMRSSTGLLSEYRFVEGSGVTIADQTGMNPLTINDEADVTWLTGGLRFNTSGFASGMSTSHVFAGCQASQELSVETWARSELQTARGPKRVVTYSQDYINRNFMLGVGDPDSPLDQVVFRLRTEVITTGGRNGYPQFVHPDVIDTTQLQHYVFTHALGMDRLYVNGVEAASFARPTDFSTWDDTYPLCVGNECDAAVEGDLRRFEGDIHLVAIYERALSPDEVQANYLAGADPELN